MAREPSFENALAFAADLIRIPELSGEEEAMARRVVEEMEALGLEEVRIDDTGNALGVARGRGDAPVVMLNAHLDVVAAGDPEGWEVPPFAGEIAEGFLHGRGAMDIKGPLALQLYTAAALAGEAPGDVLVAATVMEERGGLGMKRLLESGEVEPGAVVIGESTGGDICLGHRGRAELEVVLEGLAGHASAPERARNPLELVGAVVAAVQALARDQREDPVLGPASLVATQIDVRPETRNVVPDHVVVALDWRILPGDQEDALVARVEAALHAVLPELPEGRTVRVRMAREHQRTWTGVEEEKSLLTPGFLMDPDDPLVEAAAKAVGRRGGSGPARVRPWTFATDGGWTKGIHGLPTVGFAPGEERHAHTNEERLELEEARWCFHRQADLVQALQHSLAS